MCVEPPRPGNHEPGKQGKDRDFLFAGRRRSEGRPGIYKQEKQNEGPKNVIPNFVFCLRLGQINPGCKGQHRHLNYYRHPAMVPETEPVEMSSTRIKR